MVVRGIGGLGEVRSIGDYVPLFSCVVGSGFEKVACLQQWLVQLRIPRDESPDDGPVELKVRYSPVQRSVLLLAQIKVGQVVF